MTRINGNWRKIATIIANILINVDRAISQPGPHLLRPMVHLTAYFPSNGATIKYLCLLI